MTRTEFKKVYDSLNCYYLEIDGVERYLNLEGDKLQLGGVTNCGFFPTFEIDVDYRFSFDENLSALIEEYEEQSYNEEIK